MAALTMENAQLRAQVAEFLALLPKDAVTALVQDIQSSSALIRAWQRLDLARAMITLGYRKMPLASVKEKKE
jgi:hypothetical protein